MYLQKKKMSSTKRPKNKKSIPISSLNKLVGSGNKKDEFSDYSSDFEVSEKKTYTESDTYMWFNLADIILFFIGLIVVGVIAAIVIAYLVKIPYPHIPVQNIPSYAVQLNNTKYYEIYGGAPVTLGTKSTANITFGASVCQLASVFVGTSCTDNTLFFDLYKPVFSAISVVTPQGAITFEYINSLSALPIQFLFFLGSIIFWFFIASAFIGTFIMLFRKDTGSKYRSLYQKIICKLQMDPFRLLGGLGLDTCTGLLLVRIAGIASQTTIYLLLLVIIIKHFLYTFYDYKLGVSVASNVRKYVTKSEKFQSRLAINMFLLCLIIAFAELVVVIKVASSAKNEFFVDFSWYTIGQNYAPGISAYAFSLVMTVFIVDLIVGVLWVFGRLAYYVLGKKNTTEEEKLQQTIGIELAVVDDYDKNLQIANYFMWSKHIFRVIIIFAFLGYIVLISPSDKIYAY